MLETGYNGFGQKLADYDRRLIEEELIPSEIDRLNKNKALLEDPTQKIYLMKNYLQKQFLENLRYAAQQNYKIVRYPTRETAVKIENYSPATIEDNQSYNSGFTVQKPNYIQYLNSVQESPYTAEIFDLKEQITKENNPTKLNNLKSRLKKIEKLNKNGLLERLHIHQILKEYQINTPHFLSLLKNFIKIKKYVQLQMIKEILGMK